MVEDHSRTHRQQELYLTEVLHLKTDCEYVRLYCEHLGRRVTAFSTLRAIASSSAIAGWAVFKSYPLVWGSIIALSQVADALRHVFPFESRYRSAFALSLSLDALLIETLHEAEDVYAGHLTEAEINARRHKLMRIQQATMVKHFPHDRLPENRRILALAEKSASQYFGETFRPRTRP